MATSSLPTIGINEAVTGATADAWATAILSGLGAPLTQANLDSMVAWFNNEGGGGANNPLNTTLDTGSVTGTVADTDNPGTAPASSYDTPADGLSATIATIQMSDYSDILADLKAGTGLIGSTNAASQLLVWSGGGYSTVPASYIDFGPGTSDPGAAVTAVTGDETGAVNPGGTVTPGGTPATGAPAGPTTTSATAAAGGFDPLSLLSDITGLARDVATVIDYVFGMFGRGQGWRLVFTLVFAVSGYGAYKCLAGAGAVPEMPSLAVV